MEHTEPRSQVAVDLQLSDLLRANFWFAYSKPGMKFSVVMGCLGLLSSLVLLLLVDPPSWFGFVPLSIVVLFGLTPLIILVATRRNFAVLKEFQKHLRYEFSSTGYEARDGKSSSDVSWESVLKAVESKHSFNLFISLGLFVVIPKRCLKTKDDSARLRSILREALGERATVNTAD